MYTYTYIIYKNEDYLYTTAMLVTELIVQNKQAALFVLPRTGCQFKFYAFIISSNAELSQSSAD